jgi:hypothetical protein
MTLKKGLYQSAAAAPSKAIAVDFEGREEVSIGAVLVVLSPFAYNCLFQMRHVEQQHTVMYVRWSSAGVSLLKLSYWLT